MYKKLLSYFLSIAMIASMLPTAAFATGDSTPSDMPDNYATEALEAAMTNGILQGDGGTIRPYDNLTRAEMAAILVRAFGATQKVDLSGYTDVSSSAWYYAEMAAAVEMGIFQGSDGMLYPDANITREEAFTVLARAFALADGSVEDLSDYTDLDDVSSWAVASVAAMVSTGYVQGYDGLLSPKSNITRQDFAVIMNRMIDTYISEAGDYTDLGEGTVMINVSGVNLEDVTISGNLVIGDGAYLDQTNLDDVTVDGTLLLRGAGEVVLSGDSTVTDVILAVKEGEFTLEDDTEVGTITAHARTTQTVVDVGSSASVTEMFLYDCGTTDIEKVSGVSKSTIYTAADVTVEVEDSGKTVYVYEDDGETLSVTLLFHSTTTSSSGGTVVSVGSGSSSSSSTTYYTVTFEDNDDDDTTSVEDQVIASSGVATEPTEPTREGYTFLGWYLTDATEPYDFSTAITGDVTLYGQWELTTEDSQDDQADDGQTDDDQADDDQTDDDQVVDSVCGVDALIDDLAAEIDKLEALILSSDVSDELKTALLGLAGQLELELSQELEKLIQEDCDGTNCTCTEDLEETLAELNELIEKGISDIEAILEAQEELRDYIENGDFSDDMEEALNDLLDQMEETLADAIDQLTEDLTDLYNSDEVQDAIQEMEDTLEELEALVDSVASALEDLQDYAQSGELADDVEQAVIDAIDDLTQALEDLYNSDEVQDAITAVEDAITAVEDAIQDAMEELDAAVQDALEELEALLEQMESDLNDALDELEALLEEMDAQGSVLLSTVVDAIEEVVEKIESDIASIETMIDALESGNLADISQALEGMEFLLEDAAAMLSSVDSAIDTLLDLVEEDSVTAEVLTSISDMVDTLEGVLDTVTELYETAQDVLDLASIFIETVSVDVDSNGDIIMTLTSPETSIEEMVKALAEESEEDFIEELTALAESSGISYVSELFDLAETLGIEVDINLIFTIMEMAGIESLDELMLSADSTLGSLLTVRSLLEFTGTIDDDTMEALEDLLGDTMDESIFSFTDSEDGVYTLLELSLVDVEDMTYTQELIELVEVLGYTVDFEGVTLIVQLDMSAVTLYDDTDDDTFFWETGSSDWWADYTTYLSADDIATLTTLADALSEQYTTFISDYEVPVSDLYLLSVYYGYTVDELVAYMEYDSILDTFYTSASYATVYLTASLSTYYTVTFDDANGNLSYQMVKNGNDLLPVANPVGTMNFVGWYDENNTYYDLIEDTITADLFLTAQWASNPVISFEVDGYTYTEPQSVNYGSKVTEPDSPSKTNYTFVGWIVLGDTTETIYDFDSAVTESFTLTALWSYDASWATAEELSELFGLSPTVALSLTETEIATLITLADTMTAQYNSGLSASTWGDWLSISYTVDPADLYLLSVYTGVSVADLEEELNITYALSSYYTYTGYSTQVGLADTAAAVGSYKVITFINGTDTFYQVVLYSNYPSEPTLTSDDGDEFVIWYDSSNAAYDFSSRVYSDFTLTAQWQDEATYIAAVATSIGSEIYVIFLSPTVTSEDIYTIWVYLDCDILDLKSKILTLIDQQTLVVSYVEYQELLLTATVENYKATLTAEEIATLEALDEDLYDNYQETVTYIKRYIDTDNDELIAIALYWDCTVDELEDKIEAYLSDNHATGTFMGLSNYYYYEIYADLLEDAQGAITG